MENSQKTKTEIKKVDFFAYLSPSTPQFRHVSSNRHNRYFCDTCVNNILRYLQGYIKSFPPHTFHETSFLLL